MNDGETIVGFVCGKGGCVITDVEADAMDWAVEQVRRQHPEQVYDISDETFWDRVEALYDKRLAEVRENAAAAAARKTFAVVRGAAVPPSPDATTDG
jgi:hypothetical protein